MIMEKLVWTYELKTPVTVGERTVSVLNFKRPKTKDFLRTDGHRTSDVGADAALASSLTGEPEIIIGDIDVEDWAVIRNHLQKCWLTFFGAKVAEENFTEQAAETLNPPA